MTDTLEPRFYTDLDGEKRPISASNMSDKEVAGAVRMLLRDQLNHEAVCVMARDRILCLAEEKQRLQDATEARPVVKALEWDGKPMLTAEPTLGFLYRIRRQSSTSYEPYVNGQRLSINETHCTLEAAKQACQDHFASLITQCLEPAAPMGSEEMVERLARHLSERRRFEDSQGAYTCDDGLQVPRGVEEWTLRLDQAADMLTAALTPTEGGE